MGEFRQKIMRLLLDNNGERLPSVREKVPQVSDSCKLYSCASGLTSQSYLSMAILHMGWGIDIIGKVTPKASNGHEYILVAIDYFTNGLKRHLIEH